MSPDRNVIDVGNEHIETARWTGCRGEDGTIVLLHEGLGSVAQWRTFPSELAATTGLDVVAYSRPGYGRSSPGPARYQADFLRREASETLAGLLAAMSIENPILYGHSDGASIALLYGIGGQAPVRGMVVEAPHVFAEEQSANGLLDLVATARQGDFLDRLGVYHDDAPRMFVRWSQAWLSDEHSTWDIRPLLASITCPILAIQGDSDVYGTTAHVRAIEALAGNEVTVEILPCGHNAWRELPDGALQLVASFVEQLGN